MNERKYPYVLDIRFGGVQETQGVKMSVASKAICPHNETTLSFTY